MASESSRERPPFIAYAMAAVAITALFVANARWGETANVDAEAAAIPAWHLVKESTIDLAEPPEHNPWFLEDQYGRVVSDRAPGLIGTAVPSYSILRSSEFSNAPATLTALASTLGAIAIIVALVKPLIGAKEALMAGVVFSLGTTTWPISSAQFWPHGPGQLAAMLAVVGFSATRYAGAGVATAWAVTMRPITAVYAAAMGTLESWRSRNLRPALKYGSVAAAGIGVVLTYNYWLYGVWSLDGGGGSGLTGRFGDNFTVGWYLQNLFTMFFSLRHGLFILSPIVLVTGIGAIKYRSKIPDWARSAAVAAVFYLFIHAAFNRASGGASSFYRYPLEALALAAVALAVGGTALYQSSSTGRRLVTWTAAFSIAIQFVNVFYLSCLAGNPNTWACQLT